MLGLGRARVRFGEYRVLVDTLKRGNGEGRVLGDRGEMGKLPPTKRNISFLSRLFMGG